MSPSVRAGGREMLVKAQLAEASEELGGKVEMCRCPSAGDDGACQMEML